MLQKTQYQGWVRRTSVIFSMGLLIALVSIGLAACGYRDVGVSSPLSQAQIAQAQVQAQTRIQIQSQVKKCGIVQGLGRLEVPVDDTGAAQVENCFWQAFQRCQPATLVTITGGIDTVLIRTFTIHNNRGKCSITDTRQFRVVPRPLSSGVTYMCARVTKLPGALRFSACGQDGDVVVGG